MTVGIEPEAVWPWLVQMRRGRSGLYSYDALKNLFQLTRPTGSFSLVTRTVDSPTALVFEFTDGGWTWAFSLRSIPDGSTRLVVRNRWSSSHDGVAWKLAMCGSSNRWHS